MGHFGCVFFISIYAFDTEHQQNVCSLLALVQALVLAVKEHTEEIKPLNQGIAAAAGAPKAAEGLVGHSCISIPAFQACFGASLA